METEITENHQILMGKDVIKVLLVEDESVESRLVERLLVSCSQPIKFAVELAESLSLAIGCLGSREYDAVLLNLNLADSSGIETVRKVKEANPRIPIIVLTGLNDEETGFLAIKTAATDYLVRAANGKEALEYLRSEYTEKLCIILSDSSILRMNGIEFLRIIKADEVLKKIPVVALTTSENEEDVVHTFELRVAGYIIKVAEYKNFEEIFRTIDLYWTLSELPNGS